MRRLVAALVVLGLLAGGGALAAMTLLSDDEGGGSSERRQIRSAAPEPGARRPPEPALRPYYSQDVEWERCAEDDDFDCAELAVPLDYDDPAGETIKLALLRVPAADPDARIASLVVNPGGPGAPGTDYAAQGRQYFGSPLLARFDIVGFDPRGTGDSAPLDCLSDDQLDAYIATDPAPDTPEEEADYAAHVEAFGAGCAEHSREIATHVTTVEAARDMDVVRAALGESTLSYLGASYGTKLGATYAELFPNRVGRLVLDGAVDLAASSRQLALEQAAGFEIALRAYVQNCLDVTDTCFLGDTVEEGLGRIREFLDDVDADPLPTAGDRDLAAGNAFYGILAPLYDRDYWSLLSQALQLGFEGDGSILLLLSDALTSRGGDGYTNNLAEAVSVINCLDDPYAIPPSSVPRVTPAFEEASPTLGRVFAWGLTICGGIELESTVEPLQVQAEGVAPIVVIGTTRDPATPLVWAERLADQLASGVLIRRDGDGHTGYFAGSDCVDDAVHAYLIEGTVPEDGLSC